MTNIIMVIIGLVVAVAIAAALYDMNRKKGGKCGDHSGSCGCGTDGGGGKDGHSHSSGDSHSGDAGGGDGGGGD